MSTTLRTVAAVLVMAFGAGAAAGAADEPRLSPLARLEQLEEFAVPASVDDDGMRAALHLERRILDNLWYGQAIPVEYHTTERVLGDVRNLHGYGDSALWTGTYLAAQAFRYDTALAELAKPGGGTARRFWKIQRDDAKRRIDEMVRKFHLLSTISKDWHEEFDPRVSDTEATFGGGVIDGEPGYLQRACIPADAPAAHLWTNIGTNRRVFGPWTWDDGSQWYCENGTSRDAYAGTLFGLLVAFDLVGGKDPWVRDQIRDDVLALTDFLVKYAWTTPRPHGRVSLPLPVGSPATGHDFENFVSPLMVINAYARLMVVNAARHVTQVAGTPEQKLRYDALYRSEVASQGPTYGTSMFFDTLDGQYDGYYGYNLHHLAMYNIVRHAPAEFRDVLHQQVGMLDATTGDDDNAHFETITYALTGEPRRMQAARTHLAEWLDYRARTDVEPSTSNSPRCGADFTCVPEDQKTYRVGGQDAATAPGTATRLRAEYPLPVALRPPTDFLWQRPPTQLDGAKSPYEQNPGIDYLLPYWMQRWLTDVSPPALKPFAPFPAAVR